MTIVTAPPTLAPSFVSVRLTRDLRADIINNAIAALLGPREKALEERESVIADKLMAHHIGAKNAALMNGLPLEYFESATSVKAYDGVKTTRGLNSKKGFRIPANIRYGSPVDLPATHGMWKEIRALFADCESLQNDCKELRNQITGLIAGISTTKTLLEAWPAGAPYLPAVATKASLPAVQSDQLNLFIANLKK